MNGLLAVTSQPLEDGSASRVGKSLEEIVSNTRHAETITKWLWFVNEKILAFPRSKLFAPAKEAGFLGYLL
jgi:hypothetical protein